MRPQPLHYLTATGRGVDAWRRQFTFKTKGASLRQWFDERALYGERWGWLDTAAALTFLMMSGLAMVVAVAAGMSQ
jgi:hypothetical protein